MRPRRRFAPEPPRPARNDLVNENIRSAQVRLIDEDGTQLGIQPTKEALEIAWGKNLDLVVVAAQADPPVARVMDHSKYRYEQEQKAKLARKHQSQINVKEMKFRPKISTHDYEVKRNHVSRFLTDGSKVKITIMFRGREMAHTELGAKLLDRLAKDLASLAGVELMPKLDGRNMTMVLSPHRDAITKKPTQKKERPPREPESSEAPAAARPAKVTRAEGG